MAGSIQLFIIDLDEILGSRIYMKFYLAYFHFPTADLVEYERDINHARHGKAWKYNHRPYW